MDSEQVGIVLFLIILWSTYDVQSLSLFDLRIDHHKIETTRDLIVNTPRPRFSWKIHNFEYESQRNVRQIAYQIQLQSIITSGQDKFFQWDSDRILSSQSIHVPYTSGYDLLPSTYYHFRIRIWTNSFESPSEWTEWIRFRTPLFNLNEYLTVNSSAVWIGSTQIYMNELRKEFIVPDTSPLTSAIVYISGIGYYELYMNGNKVDESRKLDPGGTTYEQRTLIVSFDVTPNITV